MEPLVSCVGWRDWGCWCVLWRKRVTVWQETSVLICSSINTMAVVGNLLLLCGFHFSSQVLAWDRHCLDRQPCGPICQNTDIASSLLDSVLGLFFYLKETIFLLNLCDCLFISLFSFVFFLSQHISTWVSVMTKHFLTLILHPLSWVGMAPHVK